MIGISEEHVKNVTLTFGDIDDSTGYIDFTDSADYSTGYTILQHNEKPIWSTIYTIDGKPVLNDSVSKYMNTTKHNTDTRPVHLYFHRNIAELGPYTEGMDEDIASMERQIIVCSNWSELASTLTLQPKSIAFDETEFRHTSAIEILNMVRTLAKLVDMDPQKIAIAVTISKNTPLSTIKELQRSGILGIIPNHGAFGWVEAKKSILALWANIPYWPKHILDELPGAVKKAQTKPGEIKLTHRQEQILNLIKERGASNKVIAKTLNITESTVKLHVGLVLKKFGVKNRTQLALFSR